MSEFKIGETGYGFNEDGQLYSYTKDENTFSMGGLFKTKAAAIENEIAETKEYLNELYQMLDYSKCEHEFVRIVAAREWNFCVKCAFARHMR